MGPKSCLLDDLSCLALGFSRKAVPPVLVAIAWFLFFSALAHAGERADVGELWDNEVKGKNTEAILDELAVVDGLTLVPKQGEVSSLDCCMSVVLIHHLDIEPRRSPVYMASGAFLSAVQRRIHELTIERPEDVGNRDKYQPKVEAFLQDSIEKLREEQKDILALMKKRRSTVEKEGQKLTSGSMKVSVAQYYLKKSAGDLTTALRAFAKQRYLSCQIETESPPSPKHVKRAIEKKLPVLITSGNVATIIFGYGTSKQGEPFFFAYDPSIALPRVLSGARTLSENDKNSNEKWIREMTEAVKQKKYFMDHRLFTDKAITPGVRVVKMSELSGKHTATYIHGFRPNIDAIWPSIQKLVLKSKVDEGPR